MSLFRVDALKLFFFFLKEKVDSEQELNLFFIVLIRFLHSSLLFKSIFKVHDNVSAWVSILSLEKLPLRVRQYNYFVAVLYVP